MMDLPVYRVAGNYLPAAGNGYRVVRIYRPTFNSTLSMMIVPNLGKAMISFSN